jgi:hypothetical protein
LKTELGVNGDFVTILRDGDTWEKLHSQMRKDFEEYGRAVLHFYNDIIDFLFADDAIKNKNFIIEIEHYPQRLILHVLWQLHYG